MGPRGKHRIVRRSLVQSERVTDGSHKVSVTELSPADQTCLAIATGRAMFFAARLDPDVLELAVRATLDDLPFLGGRMHPVQLPVKWKMGDLKVDNNNAGAELVVIDATPLSLADCGPDTWPMKNVTISNPQIPFYLPSMDVGKALLSGAEPLCKVQLTLLVDGCVLGITLSHTITDAIRWPNLVRHLAARYRSLISGHEPNSQEFIDQKMTRPEGLSLQQLKSKLDGHGNWIPEPFLIKQPSFMDYYKTAKLFYSNSTKRVQHNILYLPHYTIVDLKAAVAEGTDLPITTGDVVQALAALMIHIAEGQPLLPILPRCMVALIQIPGAEPTYFGNAGHPMAVGLDPQEATLPPASDALATLRTLASQIRRCTLDLRQDPSKALQAIYESQQVVDAPVLKALSFLVGRRLPYITCTTNFINSRPVDEHIVFGTGLKTIGYRCLTYPLAKGMGVIRPSIAPYGKGLFVAISLTEKQMQVLRRHALLGELVPEAKFLGENVSLGDVGVKSTCFSCPRIW